MLEKDGRRHTGRWEWCETAAALQPGNQEGAPCPGAAVWLRRTCPCLHGCCLLSIQLYFLDVANLVSLKSGHVVKHQEEGVCVRTWKPGVFGSIIWTRNNFTSNKYNCFKYEVENSNLEHMRVQYTKANVLLPVSNLFLLAHSIQVVSSSRGIKKNLWERTLRTDVYYLKLTTENQCGTLVFHERRIWALLKLV